MDKAFDTGQQTVSKPPDRGRSLGWRLAISTVLIISLVMGVISITQQFLELKHERRMHQDLLRMSLAPLAVRLETAINLDTMKREVEEFHKSYVKKGYPLHEVVLFDATNKSMFSTGGSANGEDRIDYLSARIPIVSPLLNGSKGSLMVLKSSEDFRSSVRREWLLWSVHFVVTVGVVFLFLTAAIYFQVTKPVNRLVSGVKKMEKGYWGPVDLKGGAWEIRWLAWRFSNMVQEVQSAMTHLFEAEQKARSLMTRSGDKPLEVDQELSSASAVLESEQTDSSAYRELLTICKRLEAMSADDPQAEQLGMSVWKQEALEANRLGYHQLKARLEDAALHLIDPDEYKSLNERISNMKASCQEWSKQHREELNRLLEERTIPCVGVLHRVKHTAGVWAKMQSKGLRLDEVHDLFAFRIIVPTEADCYAALGVIHQHYKPVVSRFKDYIAKPKGNSYRSLHTCVSADDGPIFEVQIRSVAMDRQAERGDASHWLYKKGTRNVDQKSEVARWWQRLWRWNGEQPGP